MNSTTERRAQPCRREPLDQILTWNQDHLLHALRESEAIFNEHQPHQGTSNARPLHPLPPPITDPDRIARLDARKRQYLNGILNEHEHAT
jgi:putative transposase